MMYLQKEVILEFKAWFRELIHRSGFHKKIVITFNLEEYIYYLWFRESAREIMFGMFGMFILHGHYKSL